MDVDFLLFFLFFLKSRLLLQVLTQENLATVLTGVMVPAGAVTQPLLIPISIAGQVAGQQGLAVWTIPTATVAALPGLAAASPPGAVFKPPLAGLQGNGHSPRTARGPHRPPPPPLHVCFAMSNSESTALPGRSPGVWIPATELLQHLGLWAKTQAGVLLLSTEWDCPLIPTPDFASSQEKDHEKNPRWGLPPACLLAQGWGWGEESCWHCYQPSWMEGIAAAAVAPLLHHVHCPNPSRVSRQIPWDWSLSGPWLGT